MREIYIYIYICIYICIYLSIYIYIYVNIHLYISKTPAAVTGAPPFEVGPLCMLTPLNLESMQAVLHMSWGLLEGSWGGFWGVSWGAFGKLLGCFWGAFGGSWIPFGAQLGPKLGPC